MSPRRRQPRLPVGPLFGLVRARVDDQTLTWVDLAEMLDEHVRTVQRWRVDGLTVVHADRAAVVAGFTPHLVWGDAWDRACDERWPRSTA